MQAELAALQIADAAGEQEIEDLEGQYAILHRIVEEAITESALFATAVEEIQKEQETSDSKSAGPEETPERKREKDKRAMRLLQTVVGPNMDEILIQLEKVVKEQEETNVELDKVNNEADEGIKKIREQRLKLAEHGTKKLELAHRLAINAAKAAALARQAAERKE